MDLELIREYKNVENRFTDLINKTLPERAFKGFFMLGFLSAYVISLSGDKMILDQESDKIHNLPTKAYFYDLKKRIELKDNSFITRQLCKYAEKLLSHENHKKNKALVYASLGIGIEVFNQGSIKIPDKGELLKWD